MYFLARACYIYGMSTNDEGRNVIEIQVNETGDRAEAEDERGAILAAKTIADEAYRARGIASFKPTVTFRVEGAVVAIVNERDLWRIAL